MPSARSLSSSSISPSGRYRSNFPAQQLARLQNPAALRATFWHRRPCPRCSASVRNLRPNALRASSGLRPQGLAQMMFPDVPDVGANADALLIGASFLDASCNSRGTRKASMASRSERLRVAAIH